MKYGIFGGTFDPPHLGHLAMAEAALSHLELDEVIWIPAGKNPLKPRRAVSGKHRLKMVQLAIEGNPQFSASDIELNRQGPSYTIDTIEELMLVQPGEYMLILGSDSMKSITKWKSSEKLVNLVRFGVICRPGDNYGNTIGQLPTDFIWRSREVPMKPRNISSTQIREDIHYGRTVDHWLAPEVWQYINENGLYLD